MKGYEFINRGGIDGDRENIVAQMKERRKNNYEKTCFQFYRDISYILLYYFFV